MHYYKRNLGDYAKKAGRLSMLEHGAYTLLLDACYDRERFPTEAEAIEWAWARTEVEIAAVRFVLARFFTLTDGVYVQERIAEEVGVYQRNAENNARIARDREEKRKAAARSVHGACESGDEAPPNHKPLTINQEPGTKEVKPRAARKPAADAAPTLTVADLTTEGVDKDHAAAWFVVRKDKNAKHLTQVAWDNVKAEAKKAGISTPLAVHVCVIAGWAGFKAKWPWRDHIPDGQAPATVKANKFGGCDAVEPA
jgi:uncharacterized protein YdaU (DUF1376 family)